MPLSLYAKQQQFEQETGEAMPALLKIDSDEMANPLYFTNYGEDIVSNGITYTYWPFNAILPDSDPSSDGTATVQICNVGQQISVTLDSLEETAEVTLSLVLASDPDTIEIGPLPANIASYSTKASILSGKLAFSDDDNDLCNDRMFTPKEYPAVYE